MKNRTVVFLLVLLALGTGVLYGIACDLINTPSDIALAAGVLVLGMLFIGVPYIGVQLMRKIVLALGVVAMLPFIVGCGVTKVNPGYVGIKINSWGADKGVQQAALVTGGVMYNPITTSVFEYPTFRQSAVWTKSPTEGHPTDEEITFTTGDQMAVSADINIAYYLKADKVPEFYVAFRSDNIDNFTHGYLRNLARDQFNEVAGKYKIEQIMGDNAGFLTEVRARLQAKLDPIGVQLDQFGIIGAPRPPDMVIAAINAKVQAVQKSIQIENELRSSEAEAKKSVAHAEGEARSKVAIAEGEAKANEALTRSITPQLLEWRRYQIAEITAQKWDGKRPQVEMGGGTTPLISLPLTMDHK